MNYLRLAVEFSAPSQRSRASVSPSGRPLTFVGACQQSRRDCGYIMLRQAPVDRCIKRNRQKCMPGLNGCP
jgi:hypothetical protein